MTEHPKLKPHGSRKEKIKAERARHYVEGQKKCMMEMQNDFRQAQDDYVPRWAARSGMFISSNLRAVQRILRRYCPPIGLVSVSFRALDSLVVTNYGSSVWYGIMMLMIVLAIAPFSVVCFAASLVRDIIDFVFLSPLVWIGHRLMKLGIKIQISKVDEKGYENRQVITYWGKEVLNKTYQF